MFWLNMSAVVLMSLVVVQLSIVAFSESVSHVQIHGRHYNSTAYGPLDMSLHQYCTHESASRREKVKVHRGNETRHCPVALAAAGLKFDKLSNYMCHHDSLIPQPTTKQLPFSFNKFISFLKHNSLKLFYVGDSLSMQMFLEVGCNLEVEGALQEHADHNKFIMYSKACLLAPVVGWEVQRQTQIKTLMTTDWADEVVNSNATHVVINTGAWWNYDRFAKLTHTHVNNVTKSNATGFGGASSTTVYRRFPNDDELVAIYAAHFAEGSTLDHILTTLVRRHGIKLIWRDTTPAGMCGTDHRAHFNQFEYYKLFPVFNAIARKAVLRIGGVILPNIWTEALGHWGDHILHTASGGVDLQHYCLFSPHSLPASWNAELYKLLLSSVSSQHV